MSFEKEALKKAAKHIAFDMYHFRLYERMYKGRSPSITPTIHQAVIYSLLLHFRVLLDFFYRKPTQDDCGVGHFRVLPEFDAAFPAAFQLPPNGAREISISLNKRLAHFTATRWTERQPDMEHYAKHFDRINTLIDSFQEALPQDMQQVFLTSMHEWRRRHPDASAERKITMPAR